ncbi:metal-dependent hydrolase [Clavibacter michiganensis subsp. michiganensis]|uniref:M48 family metallopeptidase n=1 Tax=Clavibacter michiganensis TaxID=28447 RepID=UPI0013660F4B|nr:SprT family zinc-dependent metalloprotease [Clavibacter michiganensis]MWJ85024.1 metal-dependent hydrolase [Clavibacter michiganensis subsp. michiganensis]
MSTASAYLTVRGLDIDVIRKDIKHVHVGVYPPAGRVRVAAPLGFEDEQIRLAVIQRLSWIRRQRKELQAAERQSLREMVTGESHYVWGLRKRMMVVERPGRGHVEFDGNRLTLYVAPDASVEQRRSHLDRWYREQLRSALSELISTWEQRLGVAVPKWTIRKMKTKWGSCNRETHHLWFNVELAKKHPDCLEYLVVHELIHYLDGKHGTQFTALLDRNLPDWRWRRDELNGAPLAEEDWTS